MIYCLQQLHQITGNNKVQGLSVRFKNNALFCGWF